ncbi:hypothetical protein CWI36_0501p0010 [Hamiltosporidium magnivora]|uniref:Uncharacterized protein n=1 Tax=Hamiltosporidium magnivora TaxID=148818 RepID=A0A4Q9LDV9_9MICR|nr:hypothetical protein CWI36_0501p0010 [Hamiltosporidium magnivora]
MSIAESFRKFILGNPEFFEFNGDMRATIKYLFLSNNRFFLLIIFCSLICFFAFFVGIFRRRYFFGNFFLYIVGAILLFTAFCLQRSIDTREILISGKNPESISNEEPKKKNSLFYLVSLFSHDKENDQKMVEGISITKNGEDTTKTMDGKNMDTQINPIFKKEHYLDDNSSKFYDSPTKLIPEVKENNKNSILRGKFVKGITNMFKETGLYSKGHNLLRKNFFSNSKNQNDTNTNSKSTNSTNNTESNMDQKNGNHTIISFDKSLDTKDRKTKYFEKIEKNIEFKRNTDLELYKYKTDLEKRKSETEYDVYLFEKEFENFTKESKKIEKELISIDISLDLYIYEMTEMKNEIYKNFGFLGNEKKIVTKNEIEPKSGNETQSTDEPTKSNKIVEYNLKKETLSDLPMNDPDVNPLLGFNSFLSSIKSKMEDYSEKTSKKENNSVDDFYFYMESYLVVQGICVFLIFILTICQFYDLIFIFKIILIIFLIGDIFFGIPTLIYSQVISKDIETKNIPQCKEDFNFKIDGLVALLESNLGVKNSDPSKQVEFIQNQFKSIADYEKKVAANIETFIQSSLDNKSLQKINVFDNLLRKFKFIESDFDTLMDNKVDKNVYYDIIFKLKRYLEKIKNNIFSLEKSKALELYKNVSQLEYFFRTESEDVDVNVQNFIKSEAEEMKKNKQSDCKDVTKKLKSTKEKSDELSFSLLFLSTIFLILILI